MMDENESGLSSLVRRGLTTAAFLSEGILLQLALIFLLSPSRADPFVVGPPIALYAVRESDRSAMKLYMVLSVASLPLDLGAIVAASGFFLQVASLAALALKAALIYPSLKAHDALPAARPEKTLLAEENRQQMHAKVQQTVASALREELERLEWESASKPSTAARPPPPPPQQAAPAAPATTPPPPPSRLAASAAAARSAAPPPSSTADPRAPTSTRAAGAEPPAVGGGQPRPAVSRKGGGGDTTWDEV